MRAEARFRDMPHRYGRVTRALHAATAILVLWQFSIVALYKIFGESPLLNAVASVGPHGYVGIAILLFALARILWACGNAGRRPLQPGGAAGTAATAVHKAMYGLMLTIPALALARVWAKGEGWSVGGVEIFAVGAPVPIVVATADLLHGPLSWFLLALVGVHAAAAILHHAVWRDETTGRMIGSPAVVR